MAAASMQMDVDIKKEQIDTLFVSLGAKEGGGGSRGALTQRSKSAKSIKWCKDMSLSCEHMLRRADQGLMFQSSTQLSQPLPVHLGPKIWQGKPGRFAKLAGVFIL
eukprot:1141759-Pelagomonas_calceolata.AAC.1